MATCLKKQMRFASPVVKRSSKPGRVVRPSCHNSWASPSGFTMARNTFQSLSLRT
ncbi:UNVERIFIED_CONTAM: hypothetical protein GTU68_022932 [Idotea baltica]|nr:hypothetical protein [Idotea baltica]